MKSEGLFSYSITTEEVPYFPFTGAPYSPQMGIRALDLKNWMEIDGRLGRYLEAKEKILNQSEDLVLACEPEADPAALELEAALREHLLENYPDLYEQKGEEFIVRARGRSFSNGPRNGKEALRRLALYVSEDFCLLSPAPARLVAGCVCFPSRWNLAEKMGMDSAGIHGPVPRFQGIAKPTEKVLDTIKVETPVWRLNWTMHDSDELHCPYPTPSHRTLTVENVIENTWLRIERQTLQRLPRSQHVAFSIRTYVIPMRIVTAEPERRRLIHATLTEMPEDSMRYKGMSAFIEPLLKALI